jgi:hypothetical protein
MQIFSGLSDNVFRHGKGNSGAMLCGQAFPKNGVVELAVADTGHGVWNSLKRLPGLEDGLQGDGNAILTALTLKVKGPDGVIRPGLLNTLLATARKTGGELVCMSGDAALTVRGGEMRNTKVVFYPGTVVGIRLRLLSPTITTAESALEPAVPAPAPAKG